MSGMFSSGRTGQAVKETAENATSPSATPEIKAAAPLPPPQEQVDQLAASVRRNRKGTGSTITGASSGSTAGSVASNTLLGM